MVAPRPSDPVSQPEPPPVSSAMALAHRRYWRFNIVLIAALMAVGFSVSFIVPLFARELSAVRIAGFRLPFYLGAQGAILIYLALIVVYLALMTFADRALRRAAAADRAQEPAREPAR
jgi:putative solute:sodium symporter small subunit